MEFVKDDKISVWKASSRQLDFPTLFGDISVDVAIIGGGITGVTTAYQLAKAGKKVALLEAWKIGESTTGYSTGNLYSLVDERLYKIRSNFDEEAMQIVSDSRSASVDFIEQRVQEFNIQCEFARQPWYLFSETGASDNAIEKELKASAKSGLQVIEETQLPVPFSVSKAIRVDNQAQFNPLEYVKTLAENIKGENCQIYENTKVTNIDEGDPHVLHTPHGKVSAKYVVMATHTPKGVYTIHSYLGSYREYGIALKLNNEGSYPPGGIFWSSEAGKHYSFRTYEHNGEKYLLVIGEPYKVGQREDTDEGFQKLEEFASKRFDVVSLAYKWAAQHYHSVDGLPYIGKSPSNDTVFIATGFSTDGLVYGTVSGILISDLITGKENKWAKTYDPDRTSVFASAGGLLKENLNVIGQYLKDMPGATDASKLEDIKQGEGAVIEKDGEKIAAYRDENNTLHMVSAVCTHMKCIVNWNCSEKSWDCPCHGSRFTTDGKVIEGPAIADLEKKNISE